MTKNKKHKIKHFHLHLSVLLAIAMILVATGKHSSELIKTAYAMPLHYEGVRASNIREAETLHGHSNVTMARRAFVAGT